MVSNANLEDLPQLVMEKITSFLDHKQLLALEQVSRKLMCIVDAHFSITDHLVIGPLPLIECYYKATAKDKKCLDGLLKIIKRCGIRLRTIQMTNTRQFPLSAPVWNYRRYYGHFFASAEVSNSCPNIENILVSPTVNIITMLDHDMVRQQNILLDEFDAEIYANNIKLSTGGTCKLRSLQLSNRRESEATEDSYQRIVDLFSNLEQISIRNLDENFYKILPQLMENGLKYLDILSVNFRTVKKLCNICKDLTELRLELYVENGDDITALNELQLSENVKLIIEIHNVNDCFERLTEKVCNSIVSCKVSGPTDYRLMCKLKNLQEFDITNSGQLQVIAEGSFPKLRRIQTSTRVCNRRHSDSNMCDLQTFLPQLLINKGNQLTLIEIRYVCKQSMSEAWKALRHCKAAESICFHLVGMDSSSTVTYDDVAAICGLPNLQLFMFSIRERKDKNGLLVTRLRALFDRAVKEHNDFQFEHKLCQLSLFSLYRSNL